MSLIAQILLFGLKIYFYIIIVQVIVSWLIAFDVINARNPQAANLLRILDRATEPVYRPLRKFVPPIGGIDITPIIVILGIYLLENLVARFFY
jgi:YggT family protein